MVPPVKRMLRSLLGDVVVGDGRHFFIISDIRTALLVGYCYHPAN